MWNISRGMQLLYVHCTCNFMQNRFGVRSEISYETHEPFTLVLLPIKDINIVENNSLQIGDRKPNSYATA